MGQVYCGRLRKGLILLAVSTVCPALAISPLWAGPHSGILSASAVLLAVAVIVDAYAAIDAYLLARKFRSAYVLRRCNRGAVYAILIVAAVVVPMAYGAAHGAVLASERPAFRMVTDAMSPTLIRGDRILLDLWARVLLAPRRGDVAVFRPAGERTHHVVSRIVGLPGDAVEVRDGRLWINDAAQEQSPLEPGDPAAALAPPGCRAVWESGGWKRYRIAVSEDPARHFALARTVVPEGQVFILGDNRDAAGKDQSVGLFPLSELGGRITFLYLPARDWSRLGPL
jgi:signal peptidase I